MTNTTPIYKDLLHLPVKLHLYQTSFSLSDGCQLPHEGCTTILPRIEQRKSRPFQRGGKDVLTIFFHHFRVTTPFHVRVRKIQDYSLGTAEPKLYTFISPTWGRLGDFHVKTPFFSLCKQCVCSLFQSRHVCRKQCTLTEKERFEKQMFQVPHFLAKFTKAQWTSRQYRNAGVDRR